MLAQAASALRTSNRTLIYSLGGVLVFLIGLSIFAQQGPSILPEQVKNDGSAPSAPSPTPASALSDILKGHGSLTAQLYMDYVTRPLIKVDQHEYDLYGAMHWKLPKDGAEAIYTEPLGEQLCIIDLDNRQFNESGQLWASETMTWEKPGKVHGLSLGVLNHWLYSKIHGYKYYYIDIEEYADRRASWKKPLIISHILKRHKTCIYLDSDAVFNHLDLPFEWLMNYWKLSPQNNSLALAFDPDLAWNKDRFEKLYLNTGFIVAQNNARTFEIMDAWRACPDEGGKHPTCTEFRKNYAGGPTDQGGFGTYIRYDYPDDIKELPCDEANGYTQSGTKCTGEFIQHLWTGKDKWIKLVVGQQMPGDLLQTFHQQFLKERSQFWETEAELLSKDA